MKRLLVVAALVVGLAMPAWGQGYEPGMDAAKRGDFAAAVKEWTPLAERGDTVAQFLMGQMYLDGTGVPQDYVQAVTWYRQAAEQRMGAAQASLGVFYRDGRGVAQDYVQAHMWFNLAGRPGVLSDIRGMRDRLAEKMTPAQIAEAQRLAGAWLAKNGCEGCSNEGRRMVRAWGPKRLCRGGLSVLASGSTIPWTAGLRPYYHPPTERPHTAPIGVPRLRPRPG